MKPTRKGEPHWVVYIPDLTERVYGWPWKHVANCLTYESLDAVLRLYGEEACWAEVARSTP